MTQDRSSADGFRHGIYLVKLALVDEHG